MSPWTLSTSKSTHQQHSTTPGPGERKNTQIAVRHASNPSPNCRMINRRQLEHNVRKPGDSRCMSHTWRHMCPVSGCKNFGGRGYARSTFIDHLNTHCQKFLTNEIERMRAVQATSTFGDLRCCKLCGKLNQGANGQSLCKKCYRETCEFTVVKKNLSQVDRSLLTARIREANKTELRILSDIPSLLRRHWGKCVSATLALFLSVHSEAESFKALETWTKLKSVLVLPLKGGAK